jgi:hypothetical protein
MSFPSHLISFIALCYGQFCKTTMSNSKISHCIMAPENDITGIRSFMIREKHNIFVRRWRKPTGSNHERKPCERFMGRPTMCHPGPRLNRIAHINKLQLIFHKPIKKNSKLWWLTGKSFPSAHEWWQRYSWGPRELLGVGEHGLGCAWARRVVTDYQVLEKYFSACLWLVIRSFVTILVKHLKVLKSTICYDFSKTWFNGKLRRFVPFLG